LEILGICHEKSIGKIKYSQGIPDSSLYHCDSHGNTGNNLEKAQILLGNYQDTDHLKVMLRMDVLQQGRHE